MASIIKIKRSATPSSVPGSLAAGELAINTADKKLFSSDGSTVFQVGDYALANTNLAIADRLQVANAAATYETKATADSRLANTNAYIATKVSTSTFNSALANTNAYIATKLDTSSYTASDVLSKLTTVDGVSSGLDADLLDGQQGSYYAVEATEKSRLANTNAYIASVQSDVNANEATERAALANTNAYIATKVSTSTFNSALANTNTYIATKVSTSTFNSALANTNAYIASVQSDVNTNEATERAALANTNAYIATKLDTSSYTASDVLSKLTTVDGASSGLDADLLDGQQGTYYAVEATEKSRLANTNAYIASVSSTERAALANTNAYIATKANASDPSTSGFFNHTGRLTVGTNLTVSGNTHIDGNLTVEGGVTYISSSTLNVDDSMIKLAANNAADTVDTGAYAKYIESATTKYAGYFRDATDGIFKFYGSLESEPTTTVNTSGTGYTLAQVDAIIDGGTY